MLIKFSAGVLLSISLTLAQPSQAMIIGMSHEGNEWLLLFNPLCWLVLPFCLLDENAESRDNNVYTNEDLLLNGYQQSEIRQILKDQEIIKQKLESEGLTLVIDKSDDKISLRQQILELNPHASEFYLSFFTESSGY